MLFSMQLGGLGLHRIGGAGGGGGASAQYWNPSDKGSFISLSGANNQNAGSTAAGTWHSVRGLTSHNAGKWYAENLITAKNALGDVIFGVATAGMSLTTFVGAGAGGWGIQNDSGGPSTIRLAGSTVGSGLTSADVGARHMVAYDADTGRIWLGSGGTWYNSGNPATGTNPTTTITAGTALHLAHSIYRVNNTTSLNNQAGENVHTLPTGFSMWG